MNLNFSDDDDTKNETVLSQIVIKLYFAGKS